MSTFVKAISDLVSLFLEALRLAVTLPALVLVGLNVAIIGSQIEHTRLYVWLSSTDHELQRFFILSLAVILIAYMLSVMNLPIIRFFEGYPWLQAWPGPQMRRSNARLIQYMKEQVSELNEKLESVNNVIAELNQEIVELTQGIEELQVQGLHTRAAAFAETIPSLEAKVQSKVQERDRLQFQRYALGSNLALSFPQHQTWRVLPTQLGNVIANAEEEPGHLFGIDSVTLWPFLAPILTKNGYAAFVEREKAIFDFLINMAVVSLVFGVELIYVDMLQGTFQPLPAAVKAITCLAAAYLFYQASIQGAASWGFTIKTAFVLYRDSLRKELRMAPGKSFFDEYYRWELAGRFFRDHDVGVAKKLFEVLPVNQQPPDYKDRLT